MDEEILAKKKAAEGSDEETTIIDESLHLIPEELVESLSRNIYVKMKIKIAAATRERRGFKYERGYLGKKNCRYEVALFDKDVSVIHRKCEVISNLKMLDVFPENNGYILYSEKNTETAFLYYRDFESLNSVFELAVQKLSADSIKCEYHVKNNRLVFYAIVPCNHYGMLVK